MNTTPSVHVYAWRQRHGSRSEFRFNLTVKRADIGVGTNPGHTTITFDSLPFGEAAKRLTSWGFQDAKGVLRCAKAGL